jgi:MoaA/NifB/PqqE/SkfB family radical SAM enzyme
MTERNGKFGSAVNVLGRAISYQFAPRVHHLILHVTNVCNMRCQHCFVDFEDKPNDLSLDEFRSVAGAINDVVWLDIGGGEPFIRKDLPEILALFRAQELSIPTNGWFPDKTLEAVASISERWHGKLIITISLDGFESTHDEIRQNNSFKKALQTLQLLRGLKDVRVKINTIVCERNADEIVEFAGYVRDLGADYQSFILLRGNPINPQYRLPSLEKLKTIGEGVRPIQDSYCYGRKGMFAVVTRNYQTIKWDVQIRTLEEETQVIPCLGGQAHMVVYANGDVAPCELLPPVGNIRRQPIEDILSGAALGKSVSGIRNKDCFCTHDCNMLENVLFSPRHYPRLLGLTR